LGGDKTNQPHFRNFLFHLIEVAVSIDFTHKKNLFLTGFAHRKLVLWISCGLKFEFENLKLKAKNYNSKFDTYLSFNFKF